MESSHSKGVIEKSLTKELHTMVWAGLTKQAFVDNLGAPTTGSKRQREAIATLSSHGQEE